MATLSDRDGYLKLLTRPLADDMVTIITGVRRVGKSSLLEIYRKWLIEEGTDPSDILAVNFEDFANNPLRDAETFHSYVLEKNPRYLHVDEVQVLDQWARVINSLRLRDGLKICVTGSNSSLFSDQSATYLSGHYVQYHVYPLSLPEYREFASIPDSTSSEAAYQEIMSQGAFPRAAFTHDYETSLKINNDLFDSIFTRDIVMTGQVRNPESFMRVARYLFSNAGSPLSASKIANSLTSAGMKISHPTVDKYITLLCNAHLIYPCYPFDLRGKQILRSSPKYYWIDPGLRRSLLGKTSGNVGHDLENMVFLELKRRGYKVTTGVSEGKEIDFRAVHGDDEVYVQVSFTTDSESALSRELRAFEALPPGAQCVLITADRIAPNTGLVRHLDAFEFLEGAPLLPVETFL